MQNNLIQSQGKEVFVSQERESVLKQLADAVVSMDEALAVKAANQAIAIGVDPYEAIVSGLTSGMNKANELFEEEEYFVPELLLCADAMYAGIEILKARLSCRVPEGDRCPVEGTIHRS